MTTWREVSEGYFACEDDSWILYLRHDESGAMLEVFNGTQHVTTINWGPAPGAHLPDGGHSWYLKQSLKVLEAEKKKRG